MRGNGKEKIKSMMEQFALKRMRMISSLRENEDDD